MARRGLALQIAAFVVLQAVAQTAVAQTSGSGVEVDVKGFYAFGDFGGDPAFSGINRNVPGSNSANSYTLDMDTPRLDGGGVRVDVRVPFAGAWFAGLTYSGFFVDEQDSIGGLAANNDTVHANLLDRTLADNAGLNNEFDDSEVDFASDDISVDQHSVDLTAGKKSWLARGISGFYKLGLRIANSDLERDVTYQNLEGANDVDTARISLRSDMWGVGPTVAGGFGLHIMNGLTLSGEASASALFSQFDLSRRDAYTNQSAGDTEIRQIAIDSYHVVPVLDATIGLSQRIGMFEFGIGYTLQAWLGGARAISVAGWDDVDDENTFYRVTRDDIITHGIYASAKMTFGGQAEHGDEPGALFEGPVRTISDVAGFYVMGDYGGDPAFGGNTPITGANIDNDSYSQTQESPELDGGGVRASIKALGANGWFSGVAYTGLFVDDTAALGSAGADTDSVVANLLDRSLADDGDLNGDFDEGEADFASDSVEVDQHVIDLTIGRKTTGSGPVSRSWSAGLRLAAIDVDRDVIYQNLDGAADLDTARIGLQSEMRGIGPTVTTGWALRLFEGLTLSGKASASILYADFDLERRDAYVNQSAGTTQIRGVAIDQQAVVPVIESSIELTRRVGAFEFGIGYATSAWLGGARAIFVNGQDDVDNDTSVYSVSRDDIITHSIYGRAKLAFGAPSQDGPGGGPLFSGLTQYTGAVTGLYLMADYGGDTAFGPITPIAGAGIDTNSNATDEDNPNLEGGGVQVSIVGDFARDWFAGVQYTGFFVDERSSLGQTTVDLDNVHASLIDGSLADDAGLHDDFDEGNGEFASDDIEIDQHIVDLTAGKTGRVFGFANGFWKAGTRIVNTDLERNVVYQDFDGVDLDTARINFRSDMWGVGPTIGGGLSIALLHGLRLSGEASASALYSDFELSRRDAYTNQGAGDTEIRAVTIDQKALVPMFDASIGLSQAFGSLTLGVGYHVSATLGGARAVSVAARDDVNGDTTPYVVTRDDIIVHGVYARGSIKFGP